MQFRSDTLPLTPESRQEIIAIRAFQKFLPQGGASWGYVRPKQTSTRPGKRRPFLLSWGYAERARQTPAYPLLSARTAPGGRIERGKPAGPERPCTLHRLVVVRAPRLTSEGAPLNQEQRAAGITSNRALSPLPPRPPLPLPPIDSFPFDLAALAGLSGFRRTSRPAKGTRPNGRI